jgi:hypothetical protein
MYPYNSIEYVSTSKKKNDVDEIGLVLYLSCTQYYSEPCIKTDPV